jgi:hypothetical protein
MILLIENWNARNENSGGVAVSRKAVLLLRFLKWSFVSAVKSDCNRFLNANKCRQSIFIIMALWLIADDFSQNKMRRLIKKKKEHWEQSERRRAIGAKDSRCANL